MLMFIRRALAVSLSLLFILSLFFPLKAVMAASPAAPVPAPPAVVPPAIGADSGKPPSDDNKQPSTPPAVVPPAVPSDDNKQSGASPSPVAPKVEAGLSQEPKQAVSPEAEEKAGSPQSNKVAPPLTNEEKKNDSSAAKVPGKVKAAGAELGADADLPPWREKLDEHDVEKMAGCEAIADHEHKQIIIRPKNGAKEGVIYVALEIHSGVPHPPFYYRLYQESMAMLAVIQATEGYTLKFEKRIYLFRSVAPAKGDYSSFFNHVVPNDEEKYSGSTLASLGNIADVNTNFLGSLWYFLAHTRIGTKDLNILAQKKYPASVELEGAFKYMKCLTGYADFSNFQTGMGTLSMRSMFEDSGTDNFVLNFSNKVLCHERLNFKGELLGTNLQNAFKDFKGVLIANNWNDSYKDGKGRIKSAFGKSPDQLFGVKKKDAEKGYSLSSLVVTDNPELLKIKKNSKYYKKITLSYLDRKEELELPAIYDSRITPTGESDTNQPASADYMKIVKYQVDKAIHAKVAEIKRKCGLPDNFPLEAVPTKAISSTPTSLFQEYRLPIKINELMVSPQKQVVCENAAIEKININFIYADNKKLQRFHLDTAALEQQLPQGLKLHVAGNNLLNSGLLHFFPLAVGFNGSPLLQVLTQPVATISGTIQCDDNKVTKKKVDGKEEYYVYLTISGTAEYADGSSGVLTQKAEIQVLPNIPVGNKPETSATLSAYLILAGALSVILTGRSLAKK